MCKFLYFCECCLFANLGGERSIECLPDDLTLVTLIDYACSANHFRGEDGSWRVVDDSVVWNHLDEVLVFKLFNVNACLFLLDIGQLTGSP